MSKMWEPSRFEVAMSALKIIKEVRDEECSRDRVTLSLCHLVLDIIGYPLLQNEGGEVDINVMEAAEESPMQQSNGLVELCKKSFKLREELKLKTYSDEIASWI